MDILVLVQWYGREVERRYFIDASGISEDEVDVIKAWASIITVY